MEVLDKKIVAHVLKISTKEAAGKITAALAKAFPSEYTISSLVGSQGMILNADGSTVDTDPSISLSDFEKFTGIEIGIAIDSIRNNFNKHVATKQFILDFPATKIKPSKKTGLLPASATIPTVIKRLIPLDSRKEIIDQWNKLYPNYTKKGGVFKI